MPSTGKIRPEELLEVLDRIQESTKGMKTLEEWQAYIEDYTKKLAEQAKKQEKKREGIVVSTLHAVKGLEYDKVYIMNVNEGSIPYKKAVLEEALEEERRLCYVGITRAMKELTMTSAQQRMVRGETQYNRVSRFVREIPRELVDLGHTVQEHKPKIPETKSPLNSYLQMKKSFHTKAFQPQNFKVTKADSLDYGVGDTVRHIKFGVGIVKDIVEGGRDYEVTVDFDKVGVKKMFAAFAKLKKI